MWPFGPNKERRERGTDQPNSLVRSYSHNPQAEQP